MIALPEVETPDRPQSSQLVLTEEMRRTILDYLYARCVLGISIEVRLPDITWLSVTADLQMGEQSHPQLILETQQLAEEELYKYLNPYTGGPRGEGWPFGRDLHLSEIYGLLQRIPSVEYVEAVKMEISEPGQSVPTKPAPPRVRLGTHGLICSAQHVITMKQASGSR